VGPKWVEVKQANKQLIYSPRKRCAIIMAGRAVATQESLVWSYELPFHHGHQGSIPYPYPKEPAFGQQTISPAG
jgi:hypothetical protein